MAGESVIMDFLRSREEKQNQNGQQEKQIVYIDIEDLEASKENFYGLRDLEALKASISLHGLLQPVLVIPAKIEGKYTVLGGGRRRQAIEELVDEGKEELRKVPCIISDGKIQGEDTEEEPDEVQELIGKLNIISANSFREKTDWEKMEETLQIGSIIKELKNLGKLKGNVREMQVELSGIKGTQIARYNAIMNHLSLELMQAFKNNDFGISVAYELSRLSDDYQQQAWETFLENKILTLSDTEKLHNLQKEEENLEGQMEIQEFLEQETSTDNRQESVQDIPVVAEEEPEEEKEILPEEVPYFKMGGKPYGYTWYQMVKEYLKTAYTEDSAKIKSMGKEYLVLRRSERTFFYDAQGNTLFEVENTRLRYEYNWLRQTEVVAPAQQRENTEKQQSPVKRGCITQKNPYGNCVCCGNNGTVSCCAQCKESCNGRCGWIEKEPVAPPQQNTEKEIQQGASEETFKEWTPKEVLEEKQEEIQTEAVKIEQQTEKYEQTTEQTDIELLREELEKAQRYLTMLSEEFTEKDIRMRKQKLIVGALAGMIAELDNKFPEPVQPPLPKLKNNDQRKEWLNNYRSWGIWYKDEHIGATYYRYQFENSAVLIVEEYENESEYTGTYISSYLHLVGELEPERKSGIPKWTKHEKYNRYPNSETELVEFLKEIQKG